MLFSPEVQAELGEGLMLLDGDTVYITNGHWLFVVTGAQYYFDDTILSLLENTPEGSYVDWQVLNAQTLEAAQDRFVPARGRRAQPIYTDKWSVFGYKPGVTVEGVRARIDIMSPCIYGNDLVDITDLFVSGKARPVYAEDRGNLIRKNAAEAYVFKFDNRVVAVAGNYFRAIHELGFVVTAPSATLTPGEIPPLGLYADMEPAVFGYVMPRADSGIMADFHGRNIFQDAARVSWLDPDTALEALHTATAHQVDDPYPFPDLEALIATNRYDVNRAIGVLRWNGLTDEQILDLYMEGRVPALHRRHSEMLNAVARALARFDSGEANRWDVEAAKRLGYQFAMLQKVLGRVETGGLAELLDAAREHEEETAA